MPSISQSYQVQLEFTNDTCHPVSVQLQRDCYQRTTTGGSVVLKPAESVMLVLEAGLQYAYSVKTRSARVADVVAHSWKDIQCDVSKLFSGGRVDGLNVDRMWKDHRIAIWDGSDESDY